VSPVAPTRLANPPRGTRELGERREGGRAGGKEGGTDGWRERGRKGGREEGREKSTSLQTDGTVHALPNVRAKGLPGMTHPHLPVTTATKWQDLSYCRCGLSPKTTACAYVCVYTCVHQFASLLSRLDGLKFDLHMCIRWLKSHIKALTNSQIFEVRDTLSNNISNYV